MVLEDYRGHYTKAKGERPPGGSAGLTLRPVGLGTHLSASTSQRRFSTALRIASMPFIQVGLIRGLRIDAPAYIYQPTPPSRADIGI